MLGRLGRYEEELTDLRSLLVQHPGSADVHFSLGVTLQRLKRHEEAIAAIEQALSLRPNHAESHYALAVVFAMTGARTRALEAVAKAVRLKPSLKAALRAEEDLATLSNDPEFQRLVS